MRVNRVLAILLLAITIVAVSGCLEFGEMPNRQPTPTSTVSPTTLITAVPVAHVPSTQVSVTLKEVSRDQTSDGQELEKLVLTLKNTGTNDVTSVSLYYRAEDPVAREILSSGSIPAGSIPAGDQTDVTVSLPRYTYLRNFNFIATVHWGNDPIFVNDETRPWSVSLVTDKFM